MTNDYFTVKMYCIVGIADCIYNGKKITQKWGSENVCPDENSTYPYESTFKN